MRFSMPTRAFAICAAGVLLGVGCSGDPPARPTTSGGGDAAPEGCMEIRVDARDLPAELGLYDQLARVPRNPLSLAPNELRVSYMTYDQAGVGYIVVARFDPADGSSLGATILRATPPDETDAATSLSHISCNPDGVCAGLVFYKQGTATYGARIAAGQLDGSGAAAFWEFPENPEVLEPFFIGWDGEAFVLDSLVHGTDGHIRTLRLAWDGASLMPLGSPVEVGRISDVSEITSESMTDAVTGITWHASARLEGAWLSGHLRDGSPLPNSGPEQVLDLDSHGETFDSTSVALGVSGHEALVGWHSFSPGLLELVPTLDLAPAGDPLRFEDNSPYWQLSTRKSIARFNDAWWMVASTGRTLETIVMDGDAVKDRFTLSTYSVCEPKCFPHSPIDVRRFALASSGDVLWFGFWDLTQCNNDHSVHPDPRCPYRVVRVKNGCVYPALYDVPDP